MKLTKTVLTSSHATSNDETFAQNGIAGLTISPPRASKPPPPPRPMKAPPPPRIQAPEPEKEEDDDDPFADRNAVSTPKVEQDEPRW